MKTPTTSMTIINAVPDLTPEDLKHIEGVIERLASALTEAGIPPSHWPDELAIRLISSPDEYVSIAADVQPLRAVAEEVPEDKPC